MDSEDPSVSGIKPPFTLDRLKKYKMTEPHVYINALDAEKRNISNEDVVLIYNDRGRCKARALISDMVPQGVVNLPHGWWPKHYIEGHHQDLVTPITSYEFRCKSKEIQYEEVLKRTSSEEEGLNVDKPELAFVISADLLFDCLCEVKKAE